MFIYPALFFVPWYCPANFLSSHKIVWYSHLDLDQICSASPKQIRPFIWYKCRCSTLCMCWVSVELTLKLSRSNKGYQTSALTIIYTVCVAFCDLPDPKVAPPGSSSWQEEACSPLAEIWNQCFIICTSRGGLGSGFFLNKDQMTFSFFCKTLAWLLYNLSPNYTMNFSSSSPTHL
jgi:hypothetical protein